MFRFYKRSGSALRQWGLCVIFLSLTACKMPNNSSEDLPRYQHLRLFEPHRKEFVCEFESTKVPPIDAQAEALFLEARDLESPELIDDERDYGRIVSLTRQAAERKHWKAILNLASLYLEGRDPNHGTADAVALVERAMQLGIPAAYDRMGTYFMNGTGVEVDVTRAFAFWQKAAELGSPEAMAYLGKRLFAVTDTDDGYWGNIPIATIMLECALSQGYGPAADHLHFLYAYPRSPSGVRNGDRNDDTKARAVKVLHEGVKFGCADCADTLELEFGSPFQLSDMLAPHIDKSRAKRYKILGDALKFDPHLRFPNLDYILPLPPKDLPLWNGDKKVLLEGAMGKTLKSVPPASTQTSESDGRPFLDLSFKLRNTGELCDQATAPCTSYWRPTGYMQPECIRHILESYLPTLYEEGEHFEQFPDPREKSGEPIFGVVWKRCRTVWHDSEAVLSRAARRLVLESCAVTPVSTCDGYSGCPATGVWQPWIDPDHALASNVNQYWRQTWLEKGQRFPHPELDWKLPVTQQDVKWHLIDDRPVDLA